VILVSFVFFCLLLLLQLLALSFSRSFRILSFLSAALLAAASADAACVLALACCFFIAASLLSLQSKLLYTTHQLCSGE
jgi:hypothetical protein